MKTNLIFIFSFLLALCYGTVTNAQVTVGTGTSNNGNAPITSCYGYSYTEQIYLQSEITASGTITSVSFYVNSLPGSTANSEDWTIYMGHTTQTDYAANSNWVGASAMTQVFSGTVTYPTAGNWLTITLSTPFVYNNTDNLVIGIDENMTGWNCTVQWAHTNVGANRTIYYRNDSNDPDPLAPPTATATQASRPNVQLGGITQACPSTSALTATNITGTSADLGWTENGTATQWEVEYGATGFTPGTGTTAVTGSNPLNLTGLMAATDYDFYVRAICGAGDTSTWTGPTAFSTPCAALIAPFLESFPTNSLPTCWAESGDNTWEYGSSATTPTGFAFYGAANVPDHTPGGGGTFIGMDGSDNGNGETSILTSPLVDVSSLATPELSYWVFSNNVDDGALNKLIVEFYDGTNWTVVDSIQQNLGTNWVEFSTDLTTFTITGPVQVRFTITGDNSNGNPFNNDILIDDVAFRNPPSCAIPSALMTSNITATTVDISWTAGNAVQLGWEVSVVPSGMPAMGGTAAAATTFNATGLMGNTTYDVYVREICTPGDTTAWVGPINFTTACAVVIPNYSENFDSYIPTCWEEMTGQVDGTLTGTTSSWLGGTFGNITGTTAAEYNLYSSTTGQWIISPSIDLGTGNNYEVAFDVAATDYNSAGTPANFELTDSFLLVISTDNGMTWSSANTLQSWLQGSEPSATGDNVVINLSTYSGVVKFGFYGVASSSTASDFDISVDNFTVRTPPTCPAPSSLTATNITATTADLDWTENGTATNWEVEYGPVGFLPGTGMVAAATSKPTQITGLMSNTDYDYYVRSVCGAGDTSLWTGPISFTTACAVLNGDVSDDAIMINSLPFNTTGRTDSCYSDTRGSSSADVFYQLVIPSCTDSLNISLCGSSYDTYLRVYASDTTTQLDFNDDNATQCGSGGNSYLSIDVANDADYAPGDTIYILVEGYLGNEGTYVLDVTNTILCPPAANLVITEIMYNPPESGTDSLEFIEIYNAESTPVDLTGYSLLGVTHTFTGGTIAPNSYYTVAVNAQAFNTVYGMMPDAQWTSGGLSNSSEPVAIYDNNGQLVDSVRYDDGGVWPSAADGNGPSIVFCDTALDNNDGANWSASTTATGVMVAGNMVMASPGAADAICAPVVAPFEDIAPSGYFGLDSAYCGANAIASGSLIITNNTAVTSGTVRFGILINGTPAFLDSIPSLGGNVSDTINLTSLPLTAGNYTITAITNYDNDSLASNDTLSTTIIVSDPVLTINNANNVSCNGLTDGTATAAVSGGTPGYTFVWSDGSTNPILAGVGADNYTVTVTDTVGCTATNSIVITEPTAIVTNATPTDVSCNGGVDGTVNLAVSGGTGGYTYVWSNTETTPNLVVAAAGTYTVIVTDANGCTATDSATVSEPAALVATASEDGAGNATALGTGGTLPYTYAWDDANNQSTATAMNLSNGNYIVTITDDNGCTDTAAVTVFITGVESIANLSGLSLFPNPTSNNAFIQLDLVQTADVTVQVTTVTGQSVMTKIVGAMQSEQIELPTASLPTGVYLVQINIGQEQVTRKLIISRN